MNPLTDLSQILIGKLGITAGLLKACFKIFNLTVLTLYRKLS